MKIEIPKVNAKFVIPVSVRSEVLNLEFDFSNPEEFELHKKFLENGKHEPFKNRQEEDLFFANFCRKSTELLCEQFPELKKALNGEIVSDIRVWMKFMEAKNQCLIKGFNFFSKKLNKYDGVVELIK